MKAIDYSIATSDGRSMDPFRIITLTAVCASLAAFVWIGVLIIRRSGAGYDVVAGLAVLALGTALLSAAVGSYIKALNAPARVVLDQFAPASARAKDEAALMSFAVEARLRDLHGLLAAPLEPWRQWKEPASQRLLKRIALDLLPGANSKDIALVQKATITAGPVRFELASVLPNFRPADEVIGGIVSKGADGVTVEVTGTVASRAFAVQVHALEAETAAALVAAAIYAHYSVPVVRGEGVSDFRTVRGEDAAHFVLALADYRRAIRFGNRAALTQAQDRAVDLSRRRPNWPEADLLAAVILNEAALLRNTDGQTGDANGKAGDVAKKMDDDQWRIAMHREALRHLLGFMSPDVEMKRLVDLISLNTLSRIVHRGKARETERIEFRDRACLLWKKWKNDNYSETAEMISHKPRSRTRAASTRFLRQGPGSNDNELESLEAAALIRVAFANRSTKEPKDSGCITVGDVAGLRKTIPDFEQRFPELALLDEVGLAITELFEKLGSDHAAIGEVRKKVEQVAERRRATLNDPSLGVGDLSVHWDALAAEVAGMLKADQVLGTDPEDLRRRLLKVIAETDRLARGIEAAPGSWLASHLAMLKIEAAFEYTELAKNDDVDRSQSFREEAVRFASEANAHLGLPHDFGNLASNWETRPEDFPKLLALYKPRWRDKKVYSLADHWILARLLIASLHHSDEEAASAWGEIDRGTLTKQLCVELRPEKFMRRMSPTPKLDIRVDGIVAKLECSLLSAPVSRD